MDALFQKELEQLLSDEQKKDDNERVCAVLRAATTMLKVNSGKEALELLIQSERVYEGI